MGKFKRFFAGAIATVMSVGTLSALSACGNNESPTTFSIWIPQIENSEFYTNYNENPVVRYLTEAKEWNGKKISFDWSVPPSGEQTDHITRLFATESYTDVVDTSNITNSMPIAQLYDEGYIIDLTKYVNDYMPNYKAYLAAHPNLAKTATNTINGKTMYLQLWCYQGEEDMWGGWNYRRDWVAKYGKDPSTGEAFGGGHWEGLNLDGATQNEWIDTVKFPSWYSLKADGTAEAEVEPGLSVKDWYIRDIDSNWQGDVPVTIEDWEWMLGVMKEALQKEKVSNGYVMQLYSPGYFELGDLITSFGGGGGTWYTDPEKTTASFGLTEDSFREYLKCVNGWYKKGYIDTNFDSRQGLFYELDTEKVNSGKVGLWYGYNSALANQMRISANDGDICVYSARQPINTSRGSAELKYKIPTTMFQTSYEMRSFVVTDKAKKKDLATLFTMMDYMYSEEGIILNSYGLNKTQYDEYKDKTGKKIPLMESYNNNKFDGTIFTEIDGKLKYNDYIKNNDDLQAALRGSRLWGCQAPRAYEYIDPTDRITKQKCLNEYVYFRNSGEPSRSVLSYMTVSQAEQYSTIKTNIRTYASQNVPSFVRNGISDSDWAAWKSVLNGKKAGTVTNMLQSLLDSLKG